MKDSTQIQIEAESLLDLIEQTVGGCSTYDKPCKWLISEGTYGLAELPCKYACETEQAKKMYWELSRNNRALRKRFPIFWKKEVFHPELQAILGYLYCWDPNGDWDAYDVLDTPMQTVEILENLKEELKEDCEDIPEWVDVTINYLMLFAQ